MRKEVLVTKQGLEIPRSTFWDRVGGRFVLKNTEEQEERLRKELNLKESIPWLKEETNKEIERTIIQTITDLIPLTNIPIENLSIRIGEDYYSESDVSFRSDDDMNGGTISYSRRFLWDIGKKIEKDSTKRIAEIETELMFKTAHEMCHAREVKKFPERSERTATQRLDWAEDRAELAAQIFALQYLKTKPQTSPIKKEVSRLTKAIKGLKRYRLKRGY